MTHAVLRLLRLLKLGRGFEPVQVLVIAIGRTFYPLLISMFVINSVAVLLFASILFTAEQHEAVADASGSGYWVRREQGFG
eukprot:gene4263-362_t